MSGSSVTQLLADLRARDVRLMVNGDSIRVNAPRGTLSQAQLHLLRAEKSAVRTYLRLQERLEHMTFEEYSRTNLAVKLAIPWLTEHLWLVPDVTYIAQLLEEGIARGCIWTASELIDLYRIERLQEEDRRALAVLRSHFNTRILSIEDWSEEGGEATR